MATSNHANRSNSPRGANRPGPANPARLPARGANRATARQMHALASSFLGAVLACPALCRLGGAAQLPPPPPATAAYGASLGAGRAVAPGGAHPSPGSGPCPAAA